MHICRKKKKFQTLLQIKNLPKQLKIWGNEVNTGLDPKATELSRSSAGGS